MADLDLGLQVLGVEDAVAGIARVKTAAEQLGTQETRRFRSSVEQIREEVEWTERIDQAKGRLASSARQAATATQRAGGAAATTGQSVAAMSARFQGAAGAAAAVANAIGATSGGRAAGLVAAMAGAVSQSVQLGAAMGPGGVVAGAMLGAVPIVASLVDIFRDATDGQEDFAGAIQTTTSEIVSQSTALTAFLSTFRQVEEQRGTARRRFDRDITPEERRAMLEIERARLSGAERTLATGSAEQAEAAQRVVMEARTRIARLEQEELARIEREGRLSRDVQAQRDAEAAAENERRFEARQLSETNRVMRELEQEENQRRQRAREAAQADERRRAGLTGSLLTSATAGGNFVSPESAELGTVDLSGIHERNAEKTRENAEATRELARAQHELAVTANEAAATFSTGWTTSLADVQHAWDEANTALVRAGQQSMGTGRLLERSLVSVGNNIAETIGGTMKGAFEEALGAWLDGSKGFVEAAEDMAKGVIKALTMEAIVQTIVEIARGVAAAASQNWVAAPQHFAAAGAWALVGGAAGAVGAATGSFGGAAADKGAGAADPRGMARDSVRQEAPAAPININVFPGGYATQSEIRAWMVETVNGAAREGHRLDERLLPRR